MANLNLPFLLLQAEKCKFKPSITSSKIIHGSKVNVLKKEVEVEADKIGFEDTQENLLLLADEQTGSIALCSHEVYKSIKHEVKADQKSKDKFLVRFQPRLMLVPSISDQKSGPLISHCFVRCPAPNLLNASPLWLCTIHQDNILRLWNLDDGRCVMNSSPDLLVSKGLNLKNIKGFPGHVILIGDSGDVYIVNVYTMQLSSHMFMTFKGLVKCKYDSNDSILQVCDQVGQVSEFMDSKQSQNERFRVDDFTQDGCPKPLTQKQLLHLTKKQSILTFKFDKQFEVEGMGQYDVRRLKENKILAFHLFHAQSKVLIVAQDHIQQVTFQDRQDEETHANLNTKLPLKEFTKEKILVFAKFIGPKNAPNFLVTIDLDCKLSVWDIKKLLNKLNPREDQLMVMRVNLVEPELELDLFKNCTVFDYHKAWLKDAFFNELTSDFGSKRETLDASMNVLKGLFIRSLADVKTQVTGGKSPALFKFFKQEQVLYSTVQTNGDHFTKGLNLMLSWDFESLFNENQVNMNYVPLVCITNLKLFGSTSESNSNCLLSFNDLVMHSYFNKSQFDFFYSDEKITQQVTFFDKDLPSLIIGTNYGRICIVPMFQEVEDNVLPITLIDSHRRSPIKALFVAYQYARSIDREKGGHLISTSADGTVCITDLSSSARLEKLIDYQSKHRALLGRDKRRIDQFLSSRAKDQKTGRRNSMTNCFTTQNFYHYIRAQADQVFLQQTNSAVKIIFKIKTLQESIQFLQGPDKSQQAKPMESKQEAFYYACITEDSNEMVLLTFTKRGNHFKSEKLPLFSEPVDAVYLDGPTQNLMVVLRQSQQMQQYNLRNQQLSLKKRSFSDVLKMLQVDEVVEAIFLNQSNFLTQMPANDLNNLDFSSFDKEDSTIKHSILKGNGSHPILDFLSLSLTLPVQYSPQASLMAEHSKLLNDFMQSKPDLICYKRPLTNLKTIQVDTALKVQSQQKLLRVLNGVLEHTQEKSYGSDMNYRLYKQISGVTSITTDGNNICGSSQQILIANTQDVLNVLQRKMLKIRQTKQAAHEENKREDLNQNKWPAKVLSFLHPFNLDDVLDENLEQFFNLNLPFLDFRVGIQGIKNSFSFVISKEDQSYHEERDHITKIISLLKISRKCNHHAQKSKGLIKSMFLSLGAQEKPVFENIIANQIDPLDATLFLGRFFNSENWKVSSYMSTIIPAFFLSMLVALVDFDEQKMQELAQEWLSVLQLISTSTQFRHNVASPLASTKDLSLTLMSELLLKNDLNVSSCVKDIICKPFLCNQTEIGHQVLAEQIRDWKTLVVDTYEQLKRDTKPEQIQARPATETKFSLSHQEDIGRYMSVNGQYGGEMRQSIDRQSQNQLHPIQPNHQIEIQTQASKRPLFSFFGQMEIRGLISLSFYAFYCQNDQMQTLEKQVLERVSKLVIILIKEVVQRFQDNKRHIHLLTTLLYSLQCNLKTATDNFKQRAIIEDVVTLLLYIFNFYKQALNRECFLTRVTSNNFHLIRPTNAELYLKLTAAKTLLEIGVSFTDVFLELIQQHAITLVKGTEHQKNVLETLRYFIQGYGDNLEPYLVQIVHILLQCLDPNELALRKNSHKFVSVILSSMVKIFPMVAFHPETQRLAVGTHEGPIGIYDVRTSAKWKILEGHTSNVTCLSFDSRGNYLASYSAIDRTLKLWRVGNTGFFANIMGGIGKQSNQVILRNLGSNVLNPHIHVQNESKQNALDSRVAHLIPSSEGEQQKTSRPENSQRINRCRIVFMKPSEKEIELVREDGSKEMHDLVK